MEWTNLALPAVRECFRFDALVPEISLFWDAYPLLRVCLMQSEISHRETYTKHQLGLPLAA